MSGRAARPHGAARAGGIPSCGRASPRRTLGAGPRLVQLALGAGPRLVQVALGAGPRLVQVALGAFWAIDALLQLQPANFSGALVYETVLGNAEHQPQPIYGSLVTASRLLAPHHVELNVAIIVVQLAIAGGLLLPRTAKLALAASIPWALGIWWLGEGFGGDFAGKATLLVGFPGPALLYALLALVAWPRERPQDGGCIAVRGLLGERATARLWSALWVGGAILRVAPFWFPPVYALSGDLQLGLDEEPRWLAHLNMHLSDLASSAGLPLVIALALVEAGIGLGVLTRRRRWALGAGIAVATIYWAIGQQFASLLSGSATDIAAGPLYVLLALTLWPAAAARTRRRHLPGVIAKRASSRTSSCGADLSW
jgi:hypothetical protein